MAKKLKIDSKKKKEKWRIFNCADAVVDRDMLNSSHIEIFGSGEIVVEGCKGVFEYNDTYLKIKLEKGCLIVCGSCFDITSFENSLITVKGKITSLEFC